MNNLFVPKEILKYIISFVQDLKNIEATKHYFKECIDNPLKNKAIKFKYYSYCIKYDNSRESEYYKDFYENEYNDYEEKFIQTYYTDIKDDLNILINCKCCLRHQTNRPIDIINTPLHTYKKIYNKNRYIRKYSEDTEELDSDDESNINKYTSCVCDCPCRFLARLFVRINKTTRKLYEEDIRTMLFYEANKRFNYNRLNDIERYKEHQLAFPEIIIEEEEKIF
jgi:hypothetical protein